VEQGGIIEADAGVYEEHRGQKLKPIASPVFDGYRSCLPDVSSARGEDDSSQESIEDGGPPEMFGQGPRMPRERDGQPDLSLTTPIIDYSDRPGA
jgi:hypothetical protein